MSASLLLALRVLAVLVLYAFLGSILILLWQDLRQQIQSGRRITHPPLWLLPLEEPFATAPLHNLEGSAGRDPGCDFSVPNPTISARHARFAYRQQQWWVEDLGSTNGSFLNDLLLETATVLTSGDVLRLGQVTFQIYIGAEPPARSQAQPASEPSNPTSNQS